MSILHHVISILHEKKLVILRLFMRKWHHPQSRGYSCVEKKYLSCGRSCGNHINLNLVEILAIKKNCSISHSFMHIEPSMCHVLSTWGSEHDLCKGNSRYRQSSQKNATRHHCCSTVLGPAAAALVSSSSRWGRRRRRSSSLSRWLTTPRNNIAGGPAAADSNDCTIATTTNEVGENAAVRGPSAWHCRKTTRPCPRAS